MFIIMITVIGVDGVTIRQGHNKWGKRKEIENRKGITMWRCKRDVEINKSRIKCRFNLGLNYRALNNDPDSWEKMQFVDSLLHKCQVWKLNYKVNL